MSIFDASIHTLSGEETTLAEHEGKALLIVNVASKCGLTPQYAGLEELQKRYEDRGFVVLGFPCKQHTPDAQSTPASYWLHDGGPNVHIWFIQPLAG